MNTVWYSAAHDHIMVKVSRGRVQLGCQGYNTIEYDGKKIKVPDMLNLFLWSIPQKKWMDHIHNGWLIKLGKL